MNDPGYPSRAAPAEIPQRLAVVLPSLGGGGIEGNRIRLIREWINRGIRVDLVVGNFTGPYSSQTPPEVQVFEVARRHPSLYAIGLWRYFANNRPSHVLAAPDDISVIVLILHQIVARPSRVVISVHSNLSSQIEAARGMKRLKSRLTTWLLARAVRFADGIIAVSKGVAEDLITVCPLAKDRLHVVYNPVINEHTNERITQPWSDRPVPPDIPIILFVGRLAPVKGVDTLIRGFASIRGKTSAHLVLAGDGPLRGPVQQEIQRLDLAERVHLVGFQPNPMPLMREARVLVLPSVHEGLPTVLIEALACGTQVIASDCPSGPREILADGEYGQLVPIGDAERLSSAMLAALEGRFFVAPSRLKRRAEIFNASAAADAYIRVLMGSR